MTSEYATITTAQPPATITTAQPPEREVPAFSEILRNFDCSVNEDFTLDLLVSNGFPGGRYLPVGFSVSPLLDKI